jgi:hypothetical protein
MELAPTTPEQRAEIYEDVRSMLVPGFLSHHVQVDEARFCLRSLDREDWELLQHRGHGQSGLQWKAWAVASSIWMVNGRIVLGDEDSIYALAETFAEAPKTVLEALYSTVNGLMRRVGYASDRIEGFLYEQESRRMWGTHGDVLVAQRGGRSYQRFGNAVISLWVYYNRMEDHRESEEHDWVIAKFLASPHAPKGVKKISAKDKQRGDDMERRRQRVMDRTFYEAKGLLARPTEKEAKNFRSRDDVRMAETPEELREVMRRWVAGIKDDHDHVVDNTKSRIKHDVEDRKRQAARRREALDQALVEEGFTRNQPLPLSGEAGKKFLDRMRARMPGASVVVDDHTHNRAYSKYIENNPDVGDLYVDEEGRVVSSRPVNPEMLEIMRKPADGERLSLQQQIERRRPTAQFVDEGEED